ncbi:transporter substrate-binding domain-containing protein [Tropicimonas sp. IMCC34043]|uniref:transporter substrate-binding domain-containing protein n=1 Tax=Tropicimonas sp. IMCC34043 TaxID=2248760 RepID=UPI001300A2F5|nr:transporter substrate-binding domain-containing protein [Tropicimonas sp. IMCC34043]
MVLAAAAAGVGLFMVLPATAGTLDEVKARGKLICGTQGTSPRYSFEDPLSRKLVGYEVDLCAGLAKSIGVDVEYKVVSSRNRIPELQQGRVDLLAALITYSEERNEILAFSNAYFVEPFVIAVRNDSGITDFSGLTSARIGGVKGSLLEPVIASKFPDATQISFDAPDQEYLAFEQGKVVAMAGRKGNLRELQLKIGEDQMTLLPEPLFSAAVGFAFRKDSDDLVAAANAYLAEAGASGDGAKLYETYFGDLGTEPGFTLGDPIK